MAASPQQLADVMGALTSHLNRCGSPDLIRFMADVDLSFTQVKMLMLLEDRGELSVKDVADALHLSSPRVKLLMRLEARGELPVKAVAAALPPPPPAASQAIDGLPQRGLVDRRESKSDRRSKLVSLRPGGRQIGEALIATRQQT